MKLLHYFIAPAALALALAACTKERSTEGLGYQYQSDVLRLPEQRYNYANPDLPQHLAGLKQRLGAEVTDAGATLGRVLFYDPKLSLTNNTACASCHLQEKGFADPVALSKGFDGRLTLRNASAISNTLEHSMFFWDGRETNIKSMVLRPIENHIEMGMDNFKALEKKLGTLDYYKPLFKDAFGTEAVTEARIAESLSQFLNSMVSGNSTFDRSNPTGWGSADPTVFDPSQQRGMDLFFGKARCANCHNPSASSFGFSSSLTANIGLDLNPTDVGMGVNDAAKKGMFKVPSLRNVALTGPYMHDGRFATLEDVVKHYNEGIQPVDNLDWSLQAPDGGPIKMGLTPAEQSDLIAFLKSLTDDNFTTADQFSNPFKQ
jgi:cytochrome c peroxidase